MQTCFDQMPGIFAGTLQSNFISNVVEQSEAIGVMLKRSRESVWHTVNC